ncbi:GNAT family N-acetyltransferase [Bacillus manliponensis]|uniref:GNAT family N-acetyltransferase n=1 Tax=Bacillus manliponensis TaxID=574376 RepID=UPI003516553C
MMIRKAKKEEDKMLSDLAYRSKAFWGYSEEFLEKCKDDLAVTERYIESHLVYVVEESDEVIGFYSLSTTEQKLDALFINPDYIGQGIGKLLWSHLLQQAKQLHIEEFTIDSDPYAEAFYLKMGAERIGEIQSTVFPERRLPLLCVKMEVV